MTEKMAHSKLVRILQKMNKFDFLQETHLSKTSRPDFILFKGKVVIIVEVKADKMSWSSRELKNQVQKYIRNGKKKYPNKKVLVVLASPNGTYGQSFSQLQEQLAYV